MKVSCRPPLFVLASLALSPCCTTEGTSSSHGVGAAEECEKGHMDDMAMLQVSVTQSKNATEINKSWVVGRGNASVIAADMDFERQLWMFHGLPFRLPALTSVKKAASMFFQLDHPKALARTHLEHKAQRAAAEGLYGGHRSWRAFCLSVLSGISMPIGVCLGILIGPVSDRICGAILAFGGGSLLFAVTISIYGVTLREERDGELNRSETYPVVFMGLLGAAFYLNVARWLESPEDDESFEAKAYKSEVVKRPSKRRNRKAYDALSELADLSDTDGETSTSAEQQLIVAYSMFAGLLIDGVPEGIFMGFLAAEGKLGLALIVSLFIANFPEAFSAASMMQKAGIRFWSIMMMWGGLCLLVGTLSGLSCWAVLALDPGFKDGDRPEDLCVIVEAVEGFTGGAMLACVAELMLPHAEHLVGDSGSSICSSGLMAVAGFLCAVGCSAFQ